MQNLWRLWVESGFTYPICVSAVLLMLFIFYIVALFLIYVFGYSVFVGLLLMGNIPFPLSFPFSSFPVLGPFF